MGAIADIFREYAPAYLEKFPNLPSSHRKTIGAITKCRTEEYGVILYRCEKCGENHMVYRSCGNRHCPQCQYQKSQQWLAKQQARQLPTHYFMITFTVPKTLREFIRGNQRAAYGAMFKASADSLKLLAGDSRFIGADLSGFFGVLHTWGRQLQYHPHLHFIVPGGGIDKEGTQWLPAKINFYAPVKGLSRIYRAKFRDAMKGLGLFDLIDPAVWKSEWVVNSQAVGNAEASLKYLTPYVFRVAISDRRILSVKNGVVTFRYFRQQSKRPRQMSLDVFEFMRRFLQHVLPDGFMKVRHFGFMSPNCAIGIAALRIMILSQSAVGIPEENKEARSEKVYAPRCPKCEGLLVYVMSIIPPWPRKPPN